MIILLLQNLSTSLGIIVPQGENSFQILRYYVNKTKQNKTKQKQKQKQKQNLPGRNCGTSPRRLLRPDVRRWLGSGSQGCREAGWSC